MSVVWSHWQWSLGIFTLIVIKQIQNNLLYFVSKYLSICTFYQAGLVILEKQILHYNSGSYKQFKISCIIRDRQYENSLQQWQRPFYLVSRTVII